MTTINQLPGLPLLSPYREVSIELVNSKGKPWQEGMRGGHYYRITSNPARDFPEPLPSVTTYLKIIDKSGPLMAWAKRVALEKVQKTLLSHQEDAGLGEHETYEDWIAAIMEEAKAQPEKERDEAAATGHDFHDDIARLLSGDAEGYTPNPTVDGALQWIKDNGVKPVAVEAPCYHPYHGAPGTVDFVGEYPNGDLVVADWKTGNGIYPEYAYQVATYARNIDVMTDRQVVEAHVVRLPREGAPITCPSCKGSPQGDPPECELCEGKGNLAYESKEVDNLNDTFATSLEAQALYASTKTSVWR